MILDRAGRPFIRVPSGESHTWHDERVVATGDPPSGGESRLVKNWRIPGHAGGQRFEIVGFLGWVPPAESEDDGVPVPLLATLAVALVALSVVAAFVLGRGRPAPD